MAKKSDPASERKSRSYRNSLQARSCRARACSGSLTPQLVLCWRSSRLFVVAIQVLLHASFVVSFHLLHLGLLVRGQQLVELVVNAGFLDRELRLDLGL